MAAVQVAAIELLAERGPREVTVRDVAERAGVNHALIHRHFGTKDEFFRSAITVQSEQIGAAAAAIGRPDVGEILAILRDNPGYWRTLARTILDAPQMLADQRMPAATAALGIVAPGENATDETRAAAAVAGSLALGWLVFGPHLATVLGVDDAQAFDQAVAKQITAAMRAARRQER